MIRRIFDPAEFKHFLPELLRDPQYSDPHLYTPEQRENNLYAALRNPNDFVLGVWEGERMIP